MRWLEFTGLASRADAHPQDLKLHRRKFFKLARALASRPRLLDEPSLGLPPLIVHEVFAAIRRVNAEACRCCWSSRT